MLIVSRSSISQTYREEVAKAFFLLKKIPNNNYWFEIMIRANNLSIDSTTLLNIETRVAKVKVPLKT